MNCPACKSNSLKPTQLQAGLPAMVCMKCSGYSVNLLSYRQWLEQQPELSESVEKVSVTSENTDKALICGKCSKIMLKYAISTGRENKVDVCTTCDEVWLDEGEWQLLVQLGLHDNLTDVMTAPWQSNMRKQAAEERYKDKYRELLGTEDFKQLMAFKDWLQDHPHAFEILNFLRN